MRKLGFPKVFKSLNECLQDAAENPQKADLRNKTVWALRRFSFERFILLNEKVFKEI